jgi:glycerophosphoryl diester phosphodiesterase
VRQGPIPVITKRSLRAARKANKPVHVWTIDEAHDMQHLIDLGVDGLMTDQSVTLKTILEANNLWVQS